MFNTFNGKPTIFGIFLPLVISLSNSNVDGVVADACVDVGVAVALFVFVVHIWLLSPLLLFVLAASLKAKRTCVVSILRLPRKLAQHGIERPGYRLAKPSWTKAA